jgi:isoleucyl-tRNA synthetase
VTETLYRDVIRPLSSGSEESVHLCRYPEADGALLDDVLERQMAVVSQVTNLGLSARNDVQIRVRQPLPELLVFSKDPIVESAVRRFAAQLQESLNVKALDAHVGEGNLPVEYELKPNFKTVGRKLGAKVKLLKPALDALDAAAVAARVEAGEDVVVPVDGADVTLAPEDLVVESRPRADLAVKQEGGLTVALRTTLTPELEREGRERDITRVLQEVRKDVGLAVEDRIRVRWETTDEALRDAMAAHGAEIAAEILALDFAEGALEGDVREVEVQDRPLRVTVARFER